MSGPRVLVVDDDADVARLVEVGLQLDGFDVVTAPHVGRALEILATEQVDLVVTDLSMPGADGFDLIAALRSDPAHADLPVIVLTARTAAADNVHALGVGADSLITKPFDSSELSARVHSLLRRNADLRAVSPLTNLPGNRRIEATIAARLELGAPTAVAYVDLDHFKAFNDVYGFLRGDRLITAVAAVLRTAAARAGPPSPFLGHVGGDDFVVVCDPGQLGALTAAVVDGVGEVRRDLHDPVDLARGYLLSRDRDTREERQVPLVSVSVGAAVRSSGDVSGLVAAANSNKTLAKAVAGDAVVVDGVQRA